MGFRRRCWYTRKIGTKLFRGKETWLSSIDQPKYRDSFAVDSDDAKVSAAFRCPAAVQYGYAINSLIAGESITSLEDRDRTVLLFETDMLVPNASGTRSNPARVRHGRLNCSFCSGKVVSLDGYWMDLCKWSPAGSK